MRIAIAVATLLAANFAQAQAPAPAAPETLAQKEYFAKNHSYIDEGVAAMSTACGKNIAFSFDRTSWWNGKTEVETNAASAYGRCDSVVQIVKGLCETADGKAAVGANISSIHCAYGGKQSGFKLELSGGKLDYAVELDRPNIDEEITQFLKSKM